MGDAGVLQLRVDLQHGFRHGLHDVGEAPAVAFAAAEEEPPVVGQAPVVHHEFRVGHGDGFGQDLGRAVAQGFCRDDEVVDRHHAGGDVGLEPAEVAVRRKDDVAAGDLAAAGADHGAGTVVDGQHFGTFEDSRAGGGGGAAKAEGEVQGVDVARAAVDLAPL